MAVEPGTPQRLLEESLAELCRSFDIDGSRESWRDDHPVATAVESFVEVLLTLGELFA